MKILHNINTSKKNNNYIKYKYFYLYIIEINQIISST